MFLLLILLGIALSASIPPESPLFLETKKVVYDEYSVIGMNFYFDGKDTYYHVLMKIDFNISEVLLGDENDLGWGITCQKQLNCLIHEGEKEAMYKTFDYRYLDAETAVKFNEIYDKTVFTDTRLKFRFIKEINKAFQDIIGIVGMAPNGEIFKFLRSCYGDFNLALDYRKEKQTKNWVMNMYLNHEQNHVKGEHYVSLPDKWSLIASFGHQKGMQTLCVEIREKYLINFEGASKVCLKNFKKICNGASSCSSINAKYSKAETLQLVIDNIRYELKGRDYLYFENNTLKCRLKDLPHQEYCEISVGRYFIQKYPVVFIFEEKPKIRFLKVFRYNQDMNLVYKIIAFIVTALLIMLMSIEGALCRIKRKNLKAIPHYFRQSEDSDLQKNDVQCPWRGARLRRILTAYKI